MSCCASLDWRNVRDLGRASSFEFDLGQCGNCGQYVMHIYCQGVFEYRVVAKEDAHKLLATDPGPERKVLVKDWLDNSGFWETP
jgi:hypothetical protein